MDLWTSGRGPKALQRSTAPPPAPPPPADSPTSMLLLLEELRSDPALMNQLLQTRTRSVDTRCGPGVCVHAYLRCCLGELCGVLEGVDWVEEASRSSLDSKLWICSFYDVTERRSTKSGFVYPPIGFSSPKSGVSAVVALTWSESGIRWWCLVSSAVRPLWGV